MFRFPSDCLFNTIVIILIVIKAQKKRGGQPEKISRLKHMLLLFEHFSKHLFATSKNCLPFFSVPFFLLFQTNAKHAVQVSVLPTVQFLPLFLTSLLHSAVFIQTQKLIRSASCSFDPLQNSKNSVSKVMLPSRDDLLSVDKKI